jgi:hypothetical protein
MNSQRRSLCFLKWKKGFVSFARAGHSNEIRKAAPFVPVSKFRPPEA